MQLSQLIRDARKALHRTQAGLAGLVGVQMQTIHRYEAGTYEPDPLVLKKIVAISPEPFRSHMAKFLPPDLAEMDFVGLLDDATRKGIESLSQHANKTLVEMYAELVTLGLEIRLQEVKTSTFNPSPGLSPMNAAAVAGDDGMIEIFGQLFSLYGFRDSAKYAEALCRISLQ